ncbi:hypothetical protein KI688_009111 [Linnemannia hyalina]|uniref:Uncharacterized protein n=1 Tax=Linnemannia hyalina TaxID=64524 RepID=A0A9P7XZ15_9FUNG|nr:hypothetical protein KI688_009111 [Linnemannia hyalina]
MNFGALTYPFFQPIGGNLPTQTAFAVLMSDNIVAEINLVAGQTQFSLNVIVNGTLGGNGTTLLHYATVKMVVVMGQA